VSKSRDLD